MGIAAGKIAHKHFRLDAAKLQRAQKLLKTGTETETVERALEMAIREQERERMVRTAHEKFLRSSIGIRDVFGALGD